MSLKLLYYLFKVCRYLVNWYVLKSHDDENYNDGVMIKTEILHHAIYFAYLLVGMFSYKIFGIQNTE